MNWYLCLYLVVWYSHRRLYPSLPLSLSLSLSDTVYSEYHDRWIMIPTVPGEILLADYYPVYRVGN